MSGLPPPARYVPDATGTPAEWPWAIAPALRDRCATRGCLGRTPKPRPSDAPAAIVLCPACRVAAGYDATAPVEAVATPARPGPPASPQTLAWVARYQRGDSAAQIARDEGAHRTSVHGALLRSAVRLEGVSGPAAVLLARLRAQAGAL